MRQSIIFQSVARFLSYILFFVSFWLLLRGHNNPGGGFVGGLIFASSFVIRVLAFGYDAVWSFLRKKRFVVLGVGLLLSFLSAFLSFALKYPFMKSMWLHVTFKDSLDLHIGTPFFFDLGVFVVVSMVIFTCVDLLLFPTKESL